MKIKRYPGRGNTIRLIIGIPAVIVLGTLTSGITALTLCRKTSLYVYFSDLSIGLILLGISFIYLIIGIILTRGITNPVEKMRKRGLEILPDTISSSRYNEIGNLSVIFDKMYLSLNSFITDRQILENIPEGFIVINSSGIIVKSNSIAETIFGADIINRHFLEVIPSHLQNKSFIENVAGALKGKMFLFPMEGKIKNREKKTFLVSLSIPKPKAGGDIIVYLKDIEEVDRIRDQIKTTEGLAGLGTISSILSHEIRNPLAAILGLLELIDREITQDDRKKEYVSKVIQEVDRLTNLTNNLLGFIQAGKLQMESDVVINNLLGYVVNIYTSEFLAKNIIVNEAYEGNLPAIKADREKLIQAFINIVTNAVQATPVGGNFTVTTELSPSGISIKFHNSGSYISPENGKKIFLPMHSAKSKGCGFGLFIAQRIINAHNGSIGVESDIKEGTSFKINLPLQNLGG